jgi:hypothetical protein
MFEMIFENEKGLRLNFGADTPYTVVEFSGLNPPKATININESPLIDGGTFNSSKTQVRSMNIAFAVEYDAEASRLNAYKVLQPKKPIRMYFKSDLLDVFIDGYVEDVDPTWWAKKQTITVSILCPAPYFKSAQEIINELKATNPAFHFAFASTDDKELKFGIIESLASVLVENNGAVEAGLIFEIYARDTVTGITIANAETSDFMTLNLTMEAGDLITITTAQGAKSITLLRNGQTTNVFNYLAMNSTWLMLPVGGAVFSYDVDAGEDTDLEITIKHYDLFEGV